MRKLNNLLFFNPQSQEDFERVFLVEDAMNDLVFFCFMFFIPMARTNNVDREEKKERRTEKKNACSILSLTRYEEFDRKGCRNNVFHADFLHLLLRLAIRYNQSEEEKEEKDNAFHFIFINH